MTEKPVTYLESLKIGWLVAWRLSVVLLALGVAFGFLLGMGGLLLGVPRNAVAAAAVAGTVPLLVFAGYPIVVRMMLNKRYSGFRVRLERDGEEGGEHEVRVEDRIPARPAEPFGGDFGRPG